MAEEIGELDLTAQANAAQTATSYITAVNSDGIKVHAANNVTTNYAGIDATGLEVVRGGKSMAKFGEVTRIGKAYVSGATDNESHMELDYHSLKLVDREGDEFFKVEDLRGTNGIAQLITKYIGDGETKKFDFQNAYPDNTSYTVTVSDNSGGSQTKSTYSVTFSSAPTKGAVITVTYDTSSRLVKTYTAGFRDDDYSAGPLSLAEGYETVANGFASHAEGLQTKALREMAHAEGTTSTASGISSHAEGSSTTASGNSAHAEGLSTQAITSQAHAEGRATVARGLAAHAEGNGCEALDYAHAEGAVTVAMGPASHSQGWHTHAKRQAQTAIGTFNVIDTSAPEDTTHPWGTGRGDEYNTGQYALIIGNGTADDARSNALAVNWNGTIESGIAGYGATTWLDLLKGNAALYVPKDPDAMSNPVGALVMETTAGGAWVMSNYSDEGIRLVYITAENRAAGTNTTTMPIKINTDGSIMTSRDINTTSVSGVFTAGSGITVAVFKFCQRGNVAAFYIGASKSTATAANTVITVGTIAAGRRPPFECAGPGTSGTGDAYINENGVVSFRSTSQIAANAQFYARVTYPVV